MSAKLIYWDVDTNLAAALSHLGHLKCLMKDVKPDCLPSFGASPCIFRLPPLSPCTEMEFMPYNNELTVILVSQLKHPALHSPCITTDCSPEFAGLIPDSENPYSLPTGPRLQA